MSSRALRRLQKDDIPVPVDDNEEVNIDENDDLLPESSVHKKKKNKKYFVTNPFDLLENGNEAEEEEEAEDKDEDSLIELVSQSDEVVKQQQQQQQSKKKKKKKKAKNSKILKDNKEIPVIDGAEDDIDASIREVNAILGDVSNHLGNKQDKEMFIVSTDIRTLLNVEHRNLNPENELKRIFGSRVIQSEQVQRRNKRGRPSSWLTTLKDNWPPYFKTGLTMSVLETAPNGSWQMFTFEHSPQYRQVQFKFYDAVESINSNNIVELLHDHPYHIDCLLQLSEICKNGEDLHMAKELIERALYSFEMSFHPLFSLTKGNCMLDFRRKENRSFYLALFKHIFYIGNKGCNRTALEYCKLLLSLDSTSDPLCVLLMIDYYALRAEEYSFLIRMYEEWEAHKNLSQLPNFAFAVPLASFHLAVKNGESTLAADKKLQESLRMFPALLLPLLDKCNINPIGAVSKSPLFTQAEIGLPSPLRQLIGLYVGRSWPCWKELQVVGWLEQNVEIVLDNFKTETKEDTEYYKKCQQRYQGTPRNICRHILLSEIKESMTELPPEITNSAILSYDVLPPRDEIETYSRPLRPQRVNNNGNVATFFRSLLPNFLIDEQVDEESGATGGDQGPRLTHSIETLLDAMRDLMGNIRPVPPPVENPQNQDEPPEERNEDEWD